MTLSASVKYRAHGRLRLQVSEKDFNEARVQEAIQALRRSPSLRRVQSNPLTRTLLIEAENAELLQSALDEVADARVIHLKVEKPAEHPESLRESWSKLCDRADAFLRDSSDGRLDLRTGVVLGLATLGLGQMTRGHFLPAGMTLLMYAAGMMDQGSAGKGKK